MNANFSMTPFMESTLPILVHTRFGTTMIHDINDKGPPRSKIAPPISDQLLLKQTLAVMAVVIITVFIILALLQIKIHKQCIPDFRKSQIKSLNGRILFILFSIALVMFYTNCIVFLAFIFQFENFKENTHPYYLIFAMVPYRIGKLCMSLFFIFRLHFVFKDSALNVNKWILITLSLLSFAATIVGCYSGTGGPLGIIDTPIAYATVSLGITMFVDIIVMIYYVQRLISVVVMQGKISEKTAMVTSDGDQVATVIQLHKKVPKWSMDFDAEFAGNNGVIEDDGGDDDEDEAINKTKTVMEITRIKVHVNKKMIGIATKSMLLSLIGIISSFWLHIEMIIRFARDNTDGVLFRALASFDGAVNLICMYLIFGFAAPYYDVGCKCCHFGLEKLCKKFSKKAVIYKQGTDTDL